MHFTKYLILLVALCGMAQAQIIKSNVFVRTDVTNETDKATARALLGMFEWVTNSVPSYTGNHSSEAALDVDDVLGDAGLRLKYGANEYMLMMNGTNLLLVSAADGSTPVYVASPPEATILTYKSLTNLFVLKTNDYGKLTLLTSDPSEIVSAAESRVYSKIGQKSRATLFGQTLDPVGLTNLAGEIVMVGPDGEATVDTIVMGGTNVVSEIANKQPQIVVEDLTALAAYSGAEDIVLVSDANTGGTFARTTGLAADGVIVVTNTVAGSVFKRQYSGPADVRWWGADGSDADDDTVALQAAADWAVADQTNIATIYGQKTIYIPPGTYILTSTVRAICNIKSETGSTILSCTDAAGLIVGSDTQNLLFAQLALPTIKKTGTARSAGTGLELRNLYYSTIDGFYVSRFATGMKVVGGPGSGLGCSYNNIVNGTLYDNQTNLYLLGDTAGWANENTFQNVYFKAPSGRERSATAFDIYAATTGTSGPNNIRFKNCSFENRGPTWFVWLEDAESWVFDGCRYENFVAHKLSAYERTSSLTTLTTAATNDFVNGDIVYVGVLDTVETIPHSFATNVTSLSVSVYDDGADVVSTPLTNVTKNVFRCPRMWLGSAPNVVISDGIFSDWLWLDSTSKHNVPARRTSQTLTADSAYTAFGLVPFRGRNYTDTLPTFAAFGTGATNAFATDMDSRTNWLSGLSARDLQIREAAGTFSRMQLDKDSLSFGPGTTTYDTTLTRSAVGTLTANGNIYATGFGVGSTAPSDGYPFVVDYDYNGGVGLKIINEQVGTAGRSTIFFQNANGAADPDYIGSAGPGQYTTSSLYPSRLFMYASAKQDGISMLVGKADGAFRVYTSSTERLGVDKYGARLRVGYSPTSMDESHVGLYAYDDQGGTTTSGRLWTLTEDGKRGPVDFGWRSPVTAQRTSLAGATKIVDESGDAIGNFDTGWTVGASWTTNSSAVVSATGATNSLSHTAVTPLVGPPRFVTMTLVSGGAWTIDADASLTVTIGGSLMRTFVNGDAPSGTMTISGMVDGSTDEVVFTVYAPDAKTVSGSFDNFSIVVLAAGDFMHRHTYPAAALVKATSATAPAPYFEFTAAGTHAANGNAKDKVIALVNTTVTSAPAILATIPSTDNNGSWRLKGKVYAAYGSGGTDYDNFMLELDYVDGSGTYVTSLHSTDLTGDVFAWNAAGYFLIGANADTADGDVTINTSSVEYKP